MKSFSRNSLATGPNIRVPLGLLSALITTAAFSSKRMYEPSARRNPFFERTITALTTSPFLTTPPGVASLTVAVMISPILPYLRYEPPMTWMHKTFLAPVLSATFNIVSC